MAANDVIGPDDPAGTNHRSAWKLVVKRAISTWKLLAKPEFSSRIAKTNAAPSTAIRNCRDRNRRSNKVIESIGDFPPESVVLLPLESGWSARVQHIETADTFTTQQRPQSSVPPLRYGGPVQGEGAAGTAAAAASRT